MHFVLSTTLPWEKGLFLKWHTKDLPADDINVDADGIDAEDEETGDGNDEEDEECAETGDGNERRVQRVLSLVVGV